MSVNGQTVRLTMGLRVISIKELPTAELDDALPF